MDTGYELRFDETPDAALGRIVAEHVNATVANLHERGTKISERVHQSRKRFKEIRALLRLFRSPLGSQFAVENRWYRDAGRELTDYRDADAVVAAVTNLSPKVRRKLGFATLRRLRRVARNEHDAIYHDTDTAEERLENIAAKLPIAAARINHVGPGMFDGFVAIEPGLIRTLRSGKRAMRAAYKTRDATAFHSWRKRVKDHWYYVQLLKSAWPQKLNEREQLLNDLSRILGEHHDLEVIRGIVAAVENTFDPAEVKQIDRTLAARQRRLERKAKPIGEKIYAQRPKAFARRLGKRWEEWRRKSSGSSSTVTRFLRAS